MISVIIVQYKNTDLTRAALSSFMKHYEKNYEIILVDNNSECDLEPIRKEFPSVALIENRHNAGFGAANNQAADRAGGDVLFFLNNDTIVQSEILSQVEQVFTTHPEVGALGPKLLNRDGTFQISAGSLPSFWSEIVDKALHGFVRRHWSLAQHYAERRHSRLQTVGWVTGAALFIRRNLFLTVKGFDENMFMYFEDKDLCARVWKNGFSVLYDPEVCLIHLKGSSSLDGSPEGLRKIYRQSQRRYYALHRPLYENLLLRLYLYSAGMCRQ